MVGRSRQVTSLLCAASAKLCRRGGFVDLGIQGFARVQQHGSVAGISGCNIQEATQQHSTNGDPAAFCKGSALMGSGPARKLSRSRSAPQRRSSRV